jgi:hypothetical protein
VPQTGALSQTALLVRFHERGERRILYIRDLPESSGKPIAALVEQ